MSRWLRKDCKDSLICILICVIWTRSHTYTRKKKEVQKMRYRSLLAKAERGIRPGDATHQELMTASKVSAAFIPSHSPYESYYGLYLKLSGVIEGGSIDPLIAERGHVMEPTCAAWFQLRHPELNVKDPHVKSPATWICADDKRMAATPDRVLEQGGEVIGLLECKTANHGEGWGPEGTAEIPKHYYEQCQWQMMCTGAEVVYVAAIIAMSYREYVVPRDEGTIFALYRAAEKMLDRIARGETPDITEPENMATYEAVRAQHPLIDPDATVNLNYATAHDYLVALEAEADAKKAVTAAKTRLLEAMGECKDAVFGDYPIAIRQAKGQGKPYVVKARRAPASHTIEKLPTVKNNPFSGVAVMEAA